MQIQHIQSFIMLCKEKNISRCSEKLHISQQGLSRQIKAMEQELGSLLFVRTTKGVELTEEGKILYPGFKKVYELYTQSTRELKDYQMRHQETIHVYVCPGIKHLLGLDFFKKFQLDNPDIHLNIEFHSDIECEEALYNGKADAAFLDWPKHKDEYNNYLVIKSPLVAVMRKDHPLGHKTVISMKDLAGLNVYIPDSSHRMTQRFKEFWPDFYNSVVIDFTTNEYESFYQDLPRLDGGVALTFQFLCDTLDSDLVSIPIVEESYVELFYCTRKDHTESRALRCFSDYIYGNVYI